jgi:CRP-like cAMP-binding protein
MTAPPPSHDDHRADTVEHSDTASGRAPADQHVRPDTVTANRTANPAPPRPSSPAAARPEDNRLLAHLPEAALQRWRPQLEAVVLPLGRVLYESGDTLSHAYFPTTAIVSLQYVTESGAASEIAAVGPEGLVGMPLLMGGGSTPSRAVVRSAGLGWRLPALAMTTAFRESGPVTTVLLRYAQALITQMAQTAACNRHHSIDQRLCRWLLQSLDRLPGHEVVVTQELMASLLGVRREGVTEAALALQGAGLIRYARGRIQVLDRAGLAARSCECYAVVRLEEQRLLGE